MEYCQRCERWFNSERALKAHNANSSRHHICYTCNLDFVGALNLIEHYVQSRNHYYCRRCDEHFDNTDYLYGHYDKVHDWCRACLMIFKNEAGLHEHRRQKHADQYCASCKRMFISTNNLRAHERSSIHAGRNVLCPLKGCGRTFVSRSALVIHLESGTCASGMNRRMIDDLVGRLDRNGVLTDPSRLLEGGSGTRGVEVTGVWATDRAWNGRDYECYLCSRYRGFRSLAALNQHLQSPAHADKRYRCPAAWYGCGKEFSTLSGFVQHMESEQCGVYRFKYRVDRAIDGLGSERLLTL